MLGCSQNDLHHFCVFDLFVDELWMHRNNPWVSNTGFGNPQIMKIDLEGRKAGSKVKQKHRQEIFDHHEAWKRRVTNSKLKQSRCEAIRNRLNKCLREHDRWRLMTMATIRLWSAMKCYRSCNYYTLYTVIFLIKWCSSSAVSVEGEHNHTVWGLIAWAYAKPESEFSNSTKTNKQTCFGPRRSPAGGRHCSQKVDAQ